MSKGGGPDGGRSRCSQNAGLAIFTAFCIIVGLDYLHLIRSTNTRGMPPPAGGSAAHTFTFDFTELPHGGRHFRVMRAAGREGARVFTCLVDRGFFSISCCSWCISNITTTF